MKLMHISDLHIGKRLNEYSLLEDQAYILEQMLDIAQSERPDAVLIAGDVYDKSVPSAEAVRLFDRFLSRLADGKRKVCVISGNHDSPERLSFGASLMVPSGVHVAPVYEGELTHVRIESGGDAAEIYMLPFVRPAHVRRFFPDESIESYTDAIRLILGGVVLDASVCNVLMTHQFVAGATLCESEEISVGGSEAVDASVFDAFDYVALGHLHSPQYVHREQVRYPGSPLKYSFSEADHKKSVTIAECGQAGAASKLPAAETASVQPGSPAAGKLPASETASIRPGADAASERTPAADITIRTVPLKPLRDMQEIRGDYATLISRPYYIDKDTQAFTRVTLTDEQEVPDAMAKLQIVYPNLLRLDYDNARTKTGASFLDAERIRDKPPIEVFSEFYEKQNGQPLSEEGVNIAKRIIEKIWDEKGGVS